LAAAAAAAAGEPEGQQQQQPSQEAAAASSYSAGILIGDEPTRYALRPRPKITLHGSDTELKLWSTSHQPQPASQRATGQARVIFLRLTLKRRRLRVCY